VVGTRRRGAVANGSSELLRALPVPIIVYDPKSLRILDANSEAAECWGWSVDELTRLDLTDLYAPAVTGPARHPADGRRRGSGGVVSGVWRHQRKDGSEIDVVALTYPAEYGGVPARVAVVEAVGPASASSSFSDIAARDEAIINASEDAIVALDGDGVVRTWNAAAERMYRYGAAEMIGQTIARLDPIGARTSTLSVIGQVIASRRPVTLSSEHVRADGSRVPVNMAVLPISDPNGRLIGLSLVTRDLSEQQRTLERDRSLSRLTALALSDAALASVLDNAVRLVADSVGAQVVSVLELVPGSDELLLVAGTGWAEARIASTRIAAARGSHFAEALTGASSVFEFTFDPGDPRLPVAPNEPATRPTVVAPVRVEDRVWGAVAAHFKPGSEPTAGERSLVEGVATSVSAGVARTQRETTRQRTEELARLAAVGQLAAGVCHDFNNVLTVVQLAAERLRTSEDLTPRGQEQMELLRGQLDHASALLWQILDFARGQSYDARVIDLGVFVEGLTGMVETIVGRGVVLSVHAGRRPLDVEADPTRLQQVLMNLVTNARDAMGRTGALSIDVATRTVTSLERGLPPGLEPGKWICLEVRDSGPGMSEEVLSRALDPFFTTKGPGRGTGLGLAQVASLVAMHDGYLGLASREGAGTTVTIWLPPRERRPRGPGEEGAGSD
jgi:PAS domain S-box-containing protein